jgi:hypothetical protein
MSRAQQLVLWTVAAVVGLGLSEILHANTLATIALVAGVGIAVGLVFAAWQQHVGPG